jgi:uncharacterized protein YjbI with pentapeptide repeats
VVLIIHAYALMHFIMLGKKASRFHNELRRQFPDAETETQKSGAALDGAQKDIRDKLRRLLPSNIFVQILAGPPELRGGIFGTLLKLIALTTLVVFPVLVLLLLQIQFLPFHDVTITWAQRGALILDIMQLWLLRPPILADLSVDGAGRSLILARGVRWFGFGFAGVASIAALWFAIVVATIPDEWQETKLAALDQPRWWISYTWNGKEMTEQVSTHVLLFMGGVNPITRRRDSPFSNTLVLPGFNLFEALKIDDPKKLEWRKHFFDLRGRHLEKAVFNGADLTKADLYGAKFQGAYLKTAHLQGVLLDEAQLQGAYLEDAQLQGASLNDAQLQGANLNSAEIQGASLEDAQLQGASLQWAHLQGALLDRAQLQGVELLGAQLQGASLEDAQLQGVSLYGVHLQGALLLRAQLQGAFLYGVELQGVELVYAQLQGASLENAKLQGASLYGANLQGANLDSAQLQGASLENAKLQGASLDGAAVNGADFSKAFLWRTKWGKLDAANLEAVRFEDATWNPFIRLRDSDPPAPWNAKFYAVLRNLMNGIPEGEMRDHALKRIERLDCTNTDKTLASCDPATAPPPDDLHWRKELAAAIVDDTAYAKALATELRSLVCASNADAIYIWRGISGRTEGRLYETGREVPALVDFIMSKDCPVSASLTDNDKAKLLKIKQEAEQEFPPPPTSKQEK